MASGRSLKASSGRTHRGTGMKGGVVVLVVVMAMVVGGGLLAWHAGGPQPMRDITVSLPVPVSSTPQVAGSVS